MSRTLLFILCVLEVNRMISGYPNQQQTIGRTITSQSRGESGLVREVASLDDGNKDSTSDVGDRDADKLTDTENNQPSEQPIGNERQTVRDPLVQFYHNVNNNDGYDVKNQSQIYPNYLISFFNKNNFKHWNHQDNGPNEHDTQKVVFPEELILSIFSKTENKNKTVNKKFVPVLPPECIGQTFCENAPDYPEDIIEEELKDDSFLRPFATEGEPMKVAQRMSNTENGAGTTNLCRSTTEPVVPKIGMTSNGEYKYILQTGNLKQWFDSEVCMQENEACGNFLWLPHSYKITCVQKYVRRKLACLSHQGKKEANWFNIKSSCCCTIDSDFKIESPQSKKAL